MVLTLGQTRMYLLIDEDLHKDLRHTGYTIYIPMFIEYRWTNGLSGFTL